MPAASDGEHVRAQGHAPGDRLHEAGLGDGVGVEEHEHLPVGVADAEVAGGARPEPAVGLGHDANGRTAARDGGWDGRAVVGDHDVRRGQGLQAQRRPRPRELGGLFVVRNDHRNPGPGRGGHVEEVPAVARHAGVGQHG